MTDRELRKLNRAELLEIMLEQSRENERLERALADAGKQLQNRKIMLSEAGSIAEAALKLNGIFEDAQKAADQYLDSIKSMGGYGAKGAPCGTDDRAEKLMSETVEKCRVMEEKTAEKCRQMEAETSQRCSLMIEQAEKRAKAYLKEARDRLRQMMENKAEQ